MTSNFGIVLLAAGASSRFGQPKQLLQYKGKSLLQHDILVAEDSIARYVVVVLGAGADVLTKEINQTKTHVVVNEHWEEGMASSIRCGVEALIEIAPGIDGTILMVCDQPYVTSPLLNDLITAQQKSGKKIITCSYANTFGPPALFHRSTFDELLQLEGDIGARKVVEQHADEVGVVLFPKGNVDIDTKEDYEKLIKSNNGE